MPVQHRIHSGFCQMQPVFLLDPDDPGKTAKSGEVIRGSGGRKSPAGQRT